MAQIQDINVVYDKNGKINANNEIYHLDHFDLIFLKILIP
jgi:hypothetical protein